MANKRPRIDQIEPYAFKTDRDEPLREKLQLRIPLSLKQKLEAKENWQEFVRQTLLEKLDAESA